MPDAATLDALNGCIVSFTKLFQALGPWWTLAYAGAACGLFFGASYLRSRQSDKGWERSLAVKDEMIEQLNEQNRELRVQALVVGGQFTKEEAANLVYGENRLNPANPPQVPARRQP